MTADEPNGPEYATTVVRLFSDYGRSVIWLDPDPVDYAETSLDDEFIAELKAWDRYARLALDPDLPEIPAHAADRFDREGRVLALRLAEELGAAFEVERRRGERYRSDEDPLNPGAASAFLRLVEQARVG